MNSPEQEHADDVDAEHIVRAAATRGLGSSPLLRGAATVTWSAFIGATLALIVMLLVPEGWLDPPVGFERLSLLFLGLWTLCMVPALCAALLCHSRTDDKDAS